ncbi:ribulose phosphate epimerase [Chelonobacter oris]|uniref:ribulose phosphate epimerase n=1 Tax=Chelonobacter oris TaxID=505317 RepID=UPI00244B7D81|nr:ribulose phosphate epimerase [Chelonobacter oris]
MKSQRISVGILAANWLKFEETLSILSNNQINLLHVDIADGQFSPLFTVGSSAIKQLSGNFYKDVHLLVNRQEKHAKQAVKCGADMVTLQLESDRDLHDILAWLNTQYIVTNGINRPVLSGLSLCPETDLSLLQPYWDRIDLIQLLTLDPRTGVKADEFSILTRIKSVMNMLGEKRAGKIITVDGSMTLDLAIKAKRLGIDRVVSRSVLFADTDLDGTLMRWKTELLAVESAV